MFFNFLTTNVFVFLKYLSICLFTNNKISEKPKNQIFWIKMFLLCVLVKRAV